MVVTSIQNVSSLPYGTGSVDEEPPVIPLIVQQFDDGARVDADKALAVERIAETLQALKGGGPEAIKPDSEGLGAVLSNRAANDMPQVFSQADVNTTSNPSHY